MVVIGGI